MVGHIVNSITLLYTTFDRLYLLITMEENFIPLETQSQANKPVTPSEPEGSKGKGKRHSEGLITAKKWTPIATQRSRKPRNSASIQGNPTLTSCTGNITIINQVVTSKGKIPKAVDNKFVQSTVKETLASKGTNQRTEKACPEPEDPEEDTLDTVVDGKAMKEIISALRFTLQFNRNLKPEDWKDIDQVLQLHQLLKDNPDRAYSDSFRLTRRRPNQLSSGFTPFRNQQISGQESPSFTIQGSFQEKTRKQGQEQNLFQTEEERVRPYDPEDVGLGKRSTQEPELVVNHSRISSPINRNITPTHIEHNVIPPESSLNSDAIWLQMSQCAEQTQKKLSELEASHEKMKKLTASKDKIFKTLQEGHAQLSKASESTNKRQNLVFEEQHHSKGDRHCLDQDINKLFNVYHNIKPQPQGHFMDNPYQPDDIKADSMFINKE
ncbi:hypothetical protein O181_067029 [Austropuccinia psidii MF-1]|uniref:Uncharacterized protein n=1 Tax=Austropuccinia psidii MF-1 TaxID=1389203 RepID=A0A9Q3EUL3_9BASI|nr:hypothetical protein [Austropuccinia psidii MF-1]